MMLGRDKVQPRPCRTSSEETCRPATCSPSTVRGTSQLYGTETGSADRIIWSRRLPTLAAHQSIERLEVRPLTALREKLGSAHGSELLGNRGGDELVDADPVRLGASLDLRLDGPGSRNG
jgi:hypothetical protein